ncbi:MAG TPA: hypothetical protein VE175_05200 [Woeseiaceae bacterium]|nr:hypothetical protein [Woeseiaceae bacterium]
MKTFAAVAIAVLVVGCAGTYKPPASGPTIRLTVESDAKEGVPVISYAGLTLYMDQVSSEKIPGTDRNRRIPIGWHKVDTANHGNEFVLPADKPLDLALTYRSDQLFGPTLTGSQGFVLYPDPGASYVMRFWTDKQHFSVQILEESPTGELKPARAIPYDES